MKDNLNEKGIHDGHRKRMRDKLVAHGARIFDTYELLEMLLYHTIPYRDTNPIAKRLLIAFGSLEGVFTATREELLSVNGIGERTADLILTVGDMLFAGELSDAESTVPVFDDYSKAGRYLVDYFKSYPDLTVSAMMLDGEMRLLGRVDITNTDLTSARIRSKAFIDEALLCGATLVIFAHTRKYTALYPMHSDIETVRMIAGDLAAIGVQTVEHYVISETDFFGVTKNLSIRLASDPPALSRFIESREEAFRR